MHKYAIEIIYSEKAQGYIATVPELPGCSALGETEEEALREVKAAIAIWISYAEVEGRKVPVPLGETLLDAIFKNAGKS